MADPKTLEPGLEAVEDAASRDLEDLLAADVRQEASASPARSIEGMVIGTLVGFTDNGATPLVTFGGQTGGTARPARTTVDLHGAHIGRDALLLFESGDPYRPIIVGCVRPATGASSADVPGRVEVDADGERLVVSAARGLVLRCGKASITLTPDGRIVARGTQIVSHAAGLNRIRGGAVQIN